MTITSAYFSNQIILDIFISGPYLIVEYLKDGTQYFTAESVTNRVVVIDGKIYEPEFIK
jgi:hypothetical protein